MRRGDGPASTSVRISAVLALLPIACCAVWGQKAPPSKQLAGTESIGDAVEAEDQRASFQSPNGNTGTAAGPITPVRPIHILYVHGINQVGSGDSQLLRKGICE